MASRIPLLVTLFVASAGCAQIQRTPAEIQPAAFPTPSSHYETYLDGYRAGLEVVSEFSYEMEPPSHVNRRVWRFGFDTAIGSGWRLNEEEFHARHW